MIPAFALLIARLLQRAIARDGAAPAIALMFLLLAQSALMISMASFLFAKTFAASPGNRSRPIRRFATSCPTAMRTSWASIMDFYPSPACFTGWI